MERQFCLKGISYVREKLAFAEYNSGAAREKSGTVIVPSCF